MLIWGWAVQGYGVEDIEVLLRKDGLSAARDWIWSIVVQAGKVKR